MKKKLILLLFLFLAACRLGINEDKQALISNTVQQVDIMRSGFVIDEVGILNEKQIADLSSSLEAYYKNSGVEILAIITSSFKKYESEQNYTDYFLYNYDRDANKSLVLVVLFNEDKKVFIRTNKNSEKIYSQKKCKEIIDFYMLPKFKSGYFFEGFVNGIKELTITNRIL